MTAWTTKPENPSMAPWVTAMAIDTPNLWRKAAFMAIRPAMLGTARPMNLVAICSVTTGQNGSTLGTANIIPVASGMNIVCPRRRARNIRPQSAPFSTDHTAA